MSASDPELRLQDGPPLPRIGRGKIRELYDAGNDALLMVTSDRVSAFDVVLPEPIPDKGRVLTQVTAWWLSTLGPSGPAWPHHLLSVRDEEIERAVPELVDTPRSQWAGRSMLVRRVEPFPVECVVRGHLAGSGFEEYRAQGTLAGEPLPKGLQLGAPLPEPRFTPATKAEPGAHDENISFSEMRRRLGPVADELRERSMALFRQAAALAGDRGLILADTKFEFGRGPDGATVLIDEVLTPDSSRYWPREEHTPGHPSPSLDKQPIRDYLASLPDWDRSPPPPNLPDQVVDAAAERYREAFRRLTGTSVEAFQAPSFGKGPGVNELGGRGRPS